MRFTALWGLASAYSRDTGRPALPFLFLSIATTASS
jgi:hypothetical protein